MKLKCLAATEGPGQESFFCFFLAPSFGQQALEVLIVLFRYGERPDLCFRSIAVLCLCVYFSVSSWRDISD